MGCGQPRGENRVDGVLPGAEQCGQCRALGQERGGLNLAREREWCGRGPAEGQAQCLESRSAVRPASSLCPLGVGRTKVGRDSLDMKVVRSEGASMGTRPLGTQGRQVSRMGSKEQNLHPLEAVGQVSVGEPEGRLDYPGRKL